MARDCHAVVKRSGKTNFDVHPAYAAGSAGDSTTGLAYSEKGLLVCGWLSQRNILNNHILNRKTLGLFTGPMGPIDRRASLVNPVAVGAS